MGHDHIDVELNQLSRELEEAVVFALGPPIVQDNVPALLVSELPKTRPQGVISAPVLRIVRCYAEIADP